MRLKSFIARLRDRFLVTESQPAPRPSDTGSLNKRIVSLGDTYLSVLGASVPNPSHLPEPLNSLSQAARTAPQPKDYAEEYALLRTEFDPAYYFAENPDIANTALNPIAHYMREARSKTQQRNPAPWFSDDHYIARCPEAATSELTPFGHYLSHNTGEGHTAAPSTTLQPWLKFWRYPRTTPSHIFASEAMICAPVWKQENWARWWKRRQATIR